MDRQQQEGEAEVERTRVAVEAVHQSSQQVAVFDEGWNVLGVQHQSANGVDAQAMLRAHEGAVNLSVVLVRRSGEAEAPEHPAWVKRSVRHGRGAMTSDVLHGTGHRSKLGVPSSTRVDALLEEARQLFL